MISNLSLRMQDTLNLMFLGHLGDKNLVAGVGLGGCFCNITGMISIYGMNMAMDTLISQAFGAGNYELCGVILNRGRLIMSLMFVPTFIFSFYVKTILIAWGMDPTVSEFSQQYVSAQVLGLYFLGLGYCQQRFLNNIGKTKIPMVGTLFATALHPLWCYIFVTEHQMNMGIVGTGIANSITYFLAFAIQFVYSQCDPDVRKSLVMPDRRTFQDLGQYLKLGLPGSFMLSLEVFSNIGVDITAGWISVDCQSA